MRISDWSSDVCSSDLIEATFLDVDRDKAVRRGHLTAVQAAELARDAGVRRLFLTHISGRYEPAEILREARRIFPRTEVAADFDRATVSSDVSWSGEASE